MNNFIDGVVVTPLTLLANERGRLLEVQRSDDPAFPGFGQIYVTQSFSGVVKAWYRHRVQVDQIAAITGLVKLVLFDDREGSPTKGAITEVIMGELAPKLVLIPSGVWHGFKAIGDTGAFLVHINNKAFAPDSPDEERCEVGSPQVPYAW